MDATILICTFNRAAQLDQTLQSIAALHAPDLRWDVLVIDNNSADDTRRVVQAHQVVFPVPLTYVFEERQGKSHALNTGLQRARASVIVFTDDDVRVQQGWLEAAVRPLMQYPEVAYTGGPVRPIWGRRPPLWLDFAGNLGGTIAIKDHGPHPFIFEDRRRTALGVNMAVRRELFNRIGGFRPDLGRSGKSLLGQEQAEFFYRSRAVGARGLYAPDMVLDHHVPASRLTHRYFRRWWYWKGISHARLHRIHSRTELGLDLNAVRRWRGVPLFILRNIFSHSTLALLSLVALRLTKAAEREMRLWYSVGYAIEQLRHGKKPMGAGASPAIDPVAPGIDTRRMTEPEQPT